MSFPPTWTSVAHTFLLDHGSALSLSLAHSHTYWPGRTCSCTSPAASSPLPTPLPPPAVIPILRRIQPLQSLLGSASPPSPLTPP